MYKSMFDKQSTEYNMRGVFGMVAGPLPLESIILNHVAVENSSRIQFTNLSCLAIIKSARLMTFKRITVNVDYLTEYETERVATVELSGP